MRFNFAVVYALTVRAGWRVLWCSLMVECGCISANSLFVGRNAGGWGKPLAIGAEAVFRNRWLVILNA